MNLLYTLLISISTMMLFMNHPLAMGMIILLQTLLISLIIGIFNKTYWFSYILILTFLGGMLILFIYMTSIASNEMFNLSFQIILKTFMIMMIYLMIWYYLYNSKYILSIINNNEMKPFIDNFIYMNNDQKLNLMKMYNIQFILMMMMLIMYLLICLLSVIKIIDNNQIPFRSMI